MAELQGYEPDQVEIESNGGFMQPKTHEFLTGRLCRMLVISFTLPGHAGKDGVLSFFHIRRRCGSKHFLNYLKTWAADFLNPPSSQFCFSMSLFFLFRCV
jgi:hypothetical protein